MDFYEEYKKGLIPVNSTIIKGLPMFNYFVSKLPEINPQFISDMILDTAIEVNILDTNDHTPLMYLIQINHPRAEELTRKLLARNINVDLKNSKGVPAVFMCLYIWAINLLLPIADIDVIDKQNNTIVTYLSKRATKHPTHSHLFATIAYRALDSPEYHTLSTGFNTDITVVLREHINEVYWKVVFMRLYAKWRNNPDMMQRLADRDYPDDILYHLTNKYLKILHTKFVEYGFMGRVDNRENSVYKLYSFIDPNGIMNFVNNYVAKVIPNDHRYAPVISIMNTLSDSDNIIKLVDINVADHKSYLVMNKLNPLNVNERNYKQTVWQIALGLFQMHNRGFVHLNIKPENLVQNDEGKVFIIDFKTTYDLACKTQHRSVLMGTRAYMAPDYIIDNIVKYSNDIWALAITMYELKTKMNPYKPMGNLEAIFNKFGSANIPLYQNYKREDVIVRLKGLNDIYLTNLLKSMFDVNPYTRPDIATVLSSNYFAEYNTPLPGILSCYEKFTDERALNSVLKYEINLARMVIKQHIKKCRTMFFANMLLERYSLFTDTITPRDTFSIILLAINYIEGRTDVISINTTRVNTSDVFAKLRFNIRVESPYNYFSTPEFKLKDHPNARDIIAYCYGLMITQDNMPCYDMADNAFSIHKYIKGDIVMNDVFIDRLRDIVQNEVFRNNFYEAWMNINSVL